MGVLPRKLSLLTNASLPDARVVDVVLDGSRVRDVLPPGTVPRPADSDGILDLTGFLLLTAPADPHAHLDKARSWQPGQPQSEGLGAAIDTWRAYAATMTRDDVESRAHVQARAMLRNGTTAIRSHVDVLLDEDPLRAIEGVVAARERLRGLVDIELVVLAKWQVPESVIEAALDAGADAVGGAPHIAPDPITEMHRLLSIAQRRGVPVDLHTDENLGDALTLGEFAKSVRGWPQNVSAGHCSRLSTLPDAQRAEILREVVASGIGIIANPITNLFLLGRGDPGSVPRGIVPAREVLAAGGRFAAGGDNVRDPFNPLGRSDAFETAMLLVVAAHLTPAQAWHAVSSGAREVMGLPLAGAVPGAVADLLAVRADSLTEAIGVAPAQRRVIHGGRLVATVQVAADLPDT